MFFFFNDTATTEIYTLSLHDALPISPVPVSRPVSAMVTSQSSSAGWLWNIVRCPLPISTVTSERCSRYRRKYSRSEEHTSELQSRQYLVCRLLLEKKKKIKGRR